MPNSMGYFHFLLCLLAFYCCLLPLCASVTLTGLCGIKWPIALNVMWAGRPYTASHENSANFASSPCDLCD